MQRCRRTGNKEREREGGEEGERCKERGSETNIKLTSIICRTVF